MLKKIFMLMAIVLFLVLGGCKADKTEEKTLSDTFLEFIETDNFTLKIIVDNRETVILYCAGDIQYEDDKLRELQRYTVSKDDIIYQYGISQIGTVNFYKVENMIFDQMNVINFKMNLAWFNEMDNKLVLKEEYYDNIVNPSFVRVNYFEIRLEDNNLVMDHSLSTQYTSTLIITKKTTYIISDINTTTVTVPDDFDSRQQDFLNKEAN